MRAPFSLADSKIAILGIGLMGGSLAMALKGRCASLYGVDPDLDTVKLAVELGFLEQASQTASDLVKKADLIILAAPVRAILSLIHELPGLHPGEAVVMDLGSTKKRIISEMADLPKRFDPIGAHPMCGKETSSLAHADPSMYIGASFALTPLPRTTPRARSLAVQIVAAAGASPLWIDADTHDRWAAATSHLPYLCANALAASTPVEAARLVGPGFRSSTRLASSSLPMMLDVLDTNREYVLEALRHYQANLAVLESHLKEEDDFHLAEFLQRGSLQQKTILSGPQEGSIS